MIPQYLMYLLVFKTGETVLIKVWTLFIYLFTQIPLSIYGITKYVKNDTPKMSIKLRILLGSIFSLLSMGLIVFLYNKVETEWHIILLIILLLQYFEANITDPVFHKINRHTSRLSYLFTTSIAITLSIGNLKSILSIILIQLTLIILMFLLNDPGPADFRAFMVVIPALVIFTKSLLLPALLLLFISVSMYQFIIQMKNGNKSLAVPIGDKIFQYGLIISLLSVIYL